MAYSVLSKLAFFLLHPIWSAILHCLCDGLYCNSCSCSVDQADFQGRNPIWPLKLKSWECEISHFEFYIYSCFESCSLAQIAIGQSSTVEVKSIHFLWVNIFTTTKKLILALLICCSDEGCYRLGVESNWADFAPYRENSVRIWLSSGLFLSTSCVPFYTIMSTVISG